LTWAVVWEPSALDAATGYLAKDPVSVDSLLVATDQLTDNPRPAASRPWGTEYRRLRHGPWRVLYRIDAAEQTVHIEHVGRVRS
jgi:mRNA-degrading endonuclease RelE of RelBE toxin-antitoxin system